MSTNKDICLDLVLDKISNKKNNKNKKESSQTLVQRFRNFLNKGTGSDISLIVENDKEVILAHKQLLMFGSPVFEKLLNENPNITSIKIPDAEAKHIKQLLKFIYLLEFEAELLAPTDILPLRYIAEKFEVFELVHYCRDFGGKNFLTIQNSCDIYAQSQKYNNKEVHDAALNFIYKNASKIIELETFKNVPEKILIEFLSKDELRVVDEIQLFNSLISWAKAECARQSMTITPKYMRSVMENIIPLIRFPVMDAQDFSINVATASILTTDEVVSILLYFNICASKKSFIPAGIFNSKPRNYYKPEVEFTFKAISLAAKEFRRCSKVKSDNTSYKMSFQVNRMIWIKSIGANAFYCAENENKVNNKMVVKIYIKESEEEKIISKRKLEVELTCDLDLYSKFAHMSFEKPVLIRPNIYYEASFKIISDITFKQYQILNAPPKNDGKREKKFKLADEFETNFEISYDASDNNSIGEITFMF